MATWFTRERTTKRREWIVPMYSGQNDHAQLLQAISAAREAYCDQYGIGRAQSLSDDTVMVSVGDAEIILWFEIERTEHPR
jgi:hypothetical protein